MSPRERAAVDDKAARLASQIGRRISELRKRAGWTQKDFAEALNSTVQWVSLVETGRQNLTIHTMVRLAHKLAVDVGELWVPPEPEVQQIKRPRGRPRKSD